MLIEALTVSNIINTTKITSGIIGSITFLFGVFKMINWIKTKLTNIDENVIKLKDSMDSHITGLRQDIKEQTHIISNALTEQRNDFRTFYAPTLLMMQQQQAQTAVPVRAKRTVRKKK